MGLLEQIAHYHHRSFKESLGASCNQKGGVALHPPDLPWLHVQGQLGKGLLGHREAVAKGQGAAGRKRLLLTRPAHTPPTAQLSPASGTAGSGANGRAGWALLNPLRPASDSPMCGGPCPQLRCYIPPCRAVPATSAPPALPWNFPEHTAGHWAALPGTTLPVTAQRPVWAWPGAEAHVRRPPVPPHLPSGPGPAWSMGSAETLLRPGHSPVWPCACFDAGGTGPAQWRAFCMLVLTGSSLCSQARCLLRCYTDTQRGDGLILQQGWGLPKSQSNRLSVFSLKPGINPMFLYPEVTKPGLTGASCSLCSLPSL